MYVLIVTLVLMMPDGKAAFYDAPQTSGFMSSNIESCEYEGTSLKEGFHPGTQHIPANVVMKTDCVKIDVP